MDLDDLRRHPGGASPSGMNSSGVKFTLVELLEMKFDMLLQIAPAFLIAPALEGHAPGPCLPACSSGWLSRCAFSGSMTKAAPSWPR
jgi:hypothetical protein